MDIANYIKNNKLKITVKPNSPKNEIISFDKEKQILKVNIKAHPDKGKANKELINFFTKLTKKHITILSGKTNRQKVLLLE